MGMPKRMSKSRAIPSCEALTDAIEEERLRLMKAHSVLRCVVTTMEVDGGGAGRPYYPSLIELAGDLVNESIRRLDSVNLRSVAARRNGADEDERKAQEEYPVFVPGEPPEVREPLAAYVVTPRIH